MDSKVPPCKKTSIKEPEIFVFKSNKDKLWYFSAYCLSLSFMLIYYNGI